jgi:hypothetical protein
MQLYQTNNKNAIASLGTAVAQQYTSFGTALFNKENAIASLGTALVRQGKQLMENYWSCANQTSQIFLPIKKCSVLFAIKFTCDNFSFFSGSLERPL